MPLACAATPLARLNVAGYANADGSIVRFLLGLHTTHGVTDTIDTAVLSKANASSM